MGLYPSTREGKYNLQPGARGETFQADMPGFRGGEDRINRTNMNFNVSMHDVPNIKYSLDSRLPILFRYGFAQGYNQIVLPKGRIVSVDPYMNMIDSDTAKANNVLTIANGGNAVNIGADGKTWQAVTNTTELTVAGEEIYYAKGNIAELSIDGPTGKVLYTPAVTPGRTAEPAEIREDIRLSNAPQGCIQRNEYTRDNNAFNGMQPGAILTDALIEIPLFAERAKAELNPWGSCYGSIRPGDLVKSDANGRFVVSPLSRLNEGAEIADFKSLELERQQVIGQVLEVKRDLVPMGAAKFAQWTMDERMSFEPMNPDMWAQTGRRNEDFVGSTPWGLQDQFGGTVGTDKNMTGINPYDRAGYPYDTTMTDHDLHMLASSVRNSDLRMPAEHQLQMGIPGLTDGGNVAVREIGPERVGTIHAAASAEVFVAQSFKASEIDIKRGSIEIAISTRDLKDLDKIVFTPVTGAPTSVPVEIVNGETADSSEAMSVTYVSELQGFFQLDHEVAKEEALNTHLLKADVLKKDIKVYVKYKKNGMGGVPTMLDWEGVQGVVSILLQK